MKRSEKEKRRVPNSLRKYRKAKGLTQKQVAKILGLESTSQISRWEKGVCLPSSLNIFKLSSLYRKMTDALFCDFLRSIRGDIQKKEKRILKAKDEDS